MCDIIDSSFIGDHDKNDMPLPFKPGRIPRMIHDSFEKSSEPSKFEGCSGTAEDEWTFRQTLYRGSLVAKGCQIAALLAKKPQAIQKNCFELGKYFFLTWQAFSELQPFRDEGTPNALEMSLISSPLLFHLSHDPTLYERLVKDLKSLDGIDHDALYNEVAKGPGVMKTEKLMVKLKEMTKEKLKNFPECDKRLKIESILKDFN